MALQAPTGEERGTLASAESKVALDELRQLLTSPYADRQDKIEALMEAVQERLDNREAQKDRCASVLVDAIEHLHDKNISLDAVLDPDVKRVVHRIFKTEPEAMAESLYPVLGPAIRRMIASLFEFTPSGKADTYKVEQLLLIHRLSSTVMASAVAQDVAVQDADVVSGMLEAIRAFIEDAFEVADYDGVNTLTLGDITVWTIWSPQAVLAVVIRGIPPGSLKPYYEKFLRELHHVYEQDFEKYDGENASDLALNDSLRKAMMTQAVPAELSNTAPLGKPAIIIATVLLAMVIIANVVSDRRAWNTAIKRLSKEPGVVVLSASRVFGNDEMVLLRDPRARDEAEILDSARLNPDEVNIQWNSFHSADPDLPGTK